nr:Chain C, Early E1A protein [unidentified adenovirus]6H6D_F Chain F, Early E1A protein [unidentified adenovirus]6H6H_C Chain C, SER-GLY-PRO-SER-ASN-THR-PRO-PRO-GLU-ILE [unidentified adenovirus]6H6H_F Chain F, SER-GLY-PRO-SER-ASN-THR-PRO-PRO-GLU-ILE [unidentified adenovirus]
SGPSNTPPEI